MFDSKTIKLFKNKKIFFEDLNHSIICSRRNYIRFHDFFWVDVNVEGGEIWIYFLTENKSLLSVPAEYEVRMKKDGNLAVHPKVAIVVVFLPDWARWGARFVNMTDWSSQNEV